MAVCDTLRHPFLPFRYFDVKFILFSLKQLALFQIYNFPINSDFRSFQTTRQCGGVAGYINFQTKKFQLWLRGGGVEDIWQFSDKKGNFYGFPTVCRKK